MSWGVAVITDIVRSREASDRGALQQAVYDAFEIAGKTIDPSVRLWATVGDEFQVVYRNAADAAVATTLVRIALPAGTDCRFGVGVGEVETVETTSQGHQIQDGSAWYRARQAIDDAHRMQSHGHPELRTWIHGTDPSATADSRAFYVLRDHVIGKMSARSRRQAGLYFSGVSQTHIARTEKVTQAAVSQSLQRSGATSLYLAMTQLHELPSARPDQREATR